MGWFYWLENKKTSSGPDNILMSVSKKKKKTKTGTSLVLIFIPILLEFRYIIRKLFLKQTYLDYLYKDNIMKQCFLKNKFVYKTLSKTHIKV